MITYEQVGREKRSIRILQVENGWLVYDSGVEYESEWLPDGMIKVTTEPCAIEWDGRQIRIFTRAKHEGQVRVRTFPSGLSELS